MKKEHTELYKPKFGVLYSSIIDHDFATPEKNKKWDPRVAVLRSHTKPYIMVLSIRLT